MTNLLPRTLVLSGALTLGAALTATPAHALEGLEWQWSTDTTRTFHIQSQIALPNVVFFNAFNNIDVRIFQARIDMVTTCTGHEPLGKKAWEVHCTIDDISIQAVSIPQDAGRLDKVTQEWDDRLTGKVMQLQFRNDGRIRNVGYDSMTRRNRRDGENLERVRQLLTRVYSPLDLGFPKKGDDKDKGTWTQKDALSQGFMSSMGTQGSVPVQHQIAGKKDSKVKIESAGTGTVGNTESRIERAGQENIEWFKMDIVSEAVFDVDSGAMVRRQMVVTANPTASAASNDGTQGLPYIQAYRVDLIREGSPPPPLPESKEIDNAFPDAN